MPKAPRHKRTSRSGSIDKTSPYRWPGRRLAVPREVTPVDEEDIPPAEPQPEQEQEQSSTPECYVCLDDVEEGAVDGVVLNPDCRHPVHVKCVKGMISSQLLECGVCKRSFTTPYLFVNGRPQLPETPDLDLDGIKEEIEVAREIQGRADTIAQALTNALEVYLRESLPWGGDDDDPDVAGEFEFNMGFHGRAMYPLDDFDEEDPNEDDVREQILAELQEQAELQREGRDAQRRRRNRLRREQEVLEATRRLAELDQARQRLREDARRRDEQSRQEAAPPVARPAAGAVARNYPWFLPSPTQPSVQAQVEQLRQRQQEDMRRRDEQSQLQAAPQVAPPAGGIPHNYPWFLPPPTQPYAQWHWEQLPPAAPVTSVAADHWTPPPPPTPMPHVVPVSPLWVPNVPAPTCPALSHAQVLGPPRVPTPWPYPAVVPPYAMPIPPYLAPHPIPRMQHTFAVPSPPVSVPGPSPPYRVAGLPYFGYPPP
ncbi:hypothetical protein M427DRAFT_62619 [Gonapodya prolifera JEL478]|uniref:RING-type domain-containing protein n=1 Tax=Gonapodya prolifera (strain JEL478) TaxID=1344416 RepID=A0A139A106_GONPJ|nr:hypothetical protein M427DRAFT_62619 [Gonapodya prolifera JEL478]|eukprot:KXS10205.1 hypothetical protein M427DRAFT_62619 [Gonapodya prolifera JEL478]